VAGSCVHVNEPADSLTGWQFHDQLEENELLKNSASWI